MKMYTDSAVSKFLMSGVIKRIEPFPGFFLMGILINFFLSLVSSYDGILPLSKNGDFNAAVRAIIDGSFFVSLVFFAFILALRFRVKDDFNKDGNDGVANPVFGSIIFLLAFIYIYFLYDFGLNGLNNLLGSKVISAIFFGLVSYSAAIWFSVFITAMGRK